MGFSRLIPGIAADVVLPVPLDEGPSEGSDQHVEEEHEEELPG